MATRKNRNKCSIIIYRKYAAALRMAREYRKTAALRAEESRIIHQLPAAEPLPVYLACFTDSAERILRRRAAVASWKSCQKANNGPCLRQNMRI